MFKEGCLRERFVLKLLREGRLLLKIAANEEQDPSSMFVRTVPWVSSNHFYCTVSIHYELILQYAEL